MATPFSTTHVRGIAFTEIPLSRTASTRANSRDGVEGPEGKIFKKNLLIARGASFPAHQDNTRGILSSSSTLLLASVSADDPSAEQGLETEG